LVEPLRVPEVGAIDKGRRSDSQKRSRAVESHFARVAAVRIQPSCIGCEASNTRQAADRTLPVGAGDV